MRRYRLSKYVRTFNVRDSVVLVHGPALRRLVLHSSLAAALAPLAGCTFTRNEYAANFEDTVAAKAFFELLESRGFVVDTEVDEEQVMAAELQISRDEPLTARENRQISLEPVKILGTHDFHTQSNESIPRLAVSLIGGCVLEVLGEHVTSSGLARGYNVSTSYSWPESVASVRAAALRGADITVLHPFHRSFMAPLCHAWSLSSPDEVERQIHPSERRLVALLEGFVEGLEGRLGVVHNLSSPQVSPNGRFDFSCFEQVHRFNLLLANMSRLHRNLFILNEEAIVSQVGKACVLDDLHEPYAHHAHGLISAADPADWSAPERCRAFLRAMCEGYFVAYDTWTGRNEIKCIVTDLDGTLWAGLAADADVGAEIEVGAARPFAGVHEALRILKNRGILLATCSKNDETTTLAGWSRRASKYGGLLPEDFAIHCINWKRKSENTRIIASRLGVAHESLLFLDDNPVEREEVRTALPGVAVWDGKVPDLRGFLLTDPRLERRGVTDEARRRTELVKHSVRRENERSTAPTEQEFLRGLQIRIDVALARQHDLERVNELVQRTNQFNTTLERIPHEQLRCLISEGNVWCARMADRFADYGLVGVVVLDSRTVRLLVLSCRVIGLRAAVPFLSAVLRSSGAATGLRAAITNGPRNGPARNVYLEAGFRADQSDSTHFELRSLDDLVPVDASIYTVTRS